MAIEVPDYNRVVTLVGQQTDGTPVIVQLDNAGRIVAVIQGAIESITGAVTVEPGSAPLDVSGTLDGVTNPVDVNQTDPAREAQGRYAGVLKTLAVDSAGRLIMVPRGNSGYYMAVDANGYLTSMMKGSYSGSPVSLAVDANGNIVALMQGEYSGTLKTIATDADGRVIMIPTDPADVWGNAIGTGNAEVIAALTPAKRFDRRGDIYHLEGFEDGIRGVDLDAYGASSAAVLSNQAARTGAYSIKATHGAATTSFAGFSIEVPHYTQTRVGVEVSWTIDQYLGYLQLFGIEYDGTNYYSYGVRWVQADSKIQYYSDVNTWTDTGETLDLYTWSFLFNTLKIVFDTENHKYVRWQLDTAGGSLADIPAASAASSLGPHIHVGCRAFGTASGVEYVFMDDLIVTQNEPA